MKETIMSKGQRGNKEAKKAKKPKKAPALSQPLAGGSTPTEATAAAPRLKK
jgi:hypothetical protein